MSTSRRICFDRLLPRDLRRFVRPQMRGALRMAVVRNKKWLNGTTLRVAFFGGTETQHRVVQQFAPQWTEHANIDFHFGDDRDAEIRIAFEADGAWSYIGLDCADIPLDQPTMNLGWLDKGVVLHEFGHAIGLIHEHQNPLGGIKWDKDRVYHDLSGPPNFWDSSTIDLNMFAAYERDSLNGTQVDPSSIMMYPIANDWTLDDFETGMNTDLSPIDRSFIGSAKNYPRSSSAKMLTINASPVSDAIGQPGEQDAFEFEVNKNGSYTIETFGETDVAMSLYGSGNTTRPIADDDDSGTNRNARITIELEPDSYRVQVRHYNPQGGTGSYLIGVRTTQTIKKTSWALS